MLAFWLQLRRQRCTSRHLFTSPSGRRSTLRCVQRRGHESEALTAFERQHAAPHGWTWSFWR